MPTLGSAVKFWRTVSEVSPRVISEELSRTFLFAFVGRPEDCQRLREALLTEHASEVQRKDAQSLIRFFEEAPGEEVAAAYAFTFYVAGADEPIGVRGNNSVPFSGDLETVIEGVLESRPGLALALARRLPRFRLPACLRLIRENSLINAQIAFFSALPGVVPGWLTPLLPVTGVADVLLLTKNQAMLVMRLAAAFGHRPGYTRQVKELMGVIGTALGWRTVARELAGLIPVAGVALKPAIAYSGTMAAGRAALWFYQRGSLPTREQIRAFEKESEAEAEAAVAQIRQDTATAASTEERP